MASKSTLPNSKVSDLEKVLSYRNRYVIETFQRDYSLSDDNAAEVFEQTLKWLWLCATYKYEVSTEKQKSTVQQLSIIGSTVIIDEMWHSFILCTKEYHAFCMEYFGFYIHHAPTPKEENDGLKQLQINDPQGYEKLMQEKLEALMGYVYDQLGHETVELWYISYADKYSMEEIAKLSKKYKT